MYIQIRKTGNENIDHVTMKITGKTGFFVLQIKMFGWPVIQWEARWFLINSEWFCILGDPGAVSGQAILLLNLTISSANRTLDPSKTALTIKKQQSGKNVIHIERPRHFFLRLHLGVALHSSWISGAMMSLRSSTQKSVSKIQNHPRRPRGS